MPPALHLKAGERPTTHYAISTVPAVSPRGE